MRWSCEFQSLFRPGAAFVEAGGRPGRWRWLRRPLGVTLLFGCVVSLLLSGSLTWSQVSLGCVTSSWVVLIEILSLAAVWRGAQRAARPLPFTRAVDLFFLGNTPWALWLIAFAALWMHFYVQWVWLASAAVVALWSGRVDYQFFRVALKSRTPGRDLALQRGIAWIAGLLIFGGGSIWPVLLGG